MTTLYKKITGIWNSVYVKRLYKPFIVYMGGNFINQLIPFILLPVLTRYLAPSDYGVWSTFTAVSGVLTTVIGMGTVGAITRGFFDKHKKNYDFAGYTSSAISINIAVFLIVLCVVAVFRPVFGRLGIPSNWPLLLPVIGICAVIYSIPFKLFIFKQRPFPFAAAEVSSTFMEVALSVFFVVCLSMGWQGRVLGISISGLIFMVVGIVVLLKLDLLRAAVRIDYIKDVLHYGSPLVLSALGIAIVAATDRIFLNKLTGLSSTGLYSVAFSITSIIVFFNGAFYLAWQPILYEKLNFATDEVKRKLVKYTYLFFILVTLIAAAVAMAAPLLLKIMVGEKFYGASRFIFWLAMANALHGMYVMMSGYVAFQKKTHFLGIIAAVTVSVNIALNYILISLNGPIGAAQTMFFTYLTKFSLMWYFGNRACPMPWFSFLRKQEAF